MNYTPRPLSPREGVYLEEYDIITSLEKIFISDAKYPSVFKLTEKDKEWIETKLSEMTLYEKCAQMIMPAVYRNFLHPGSSHYKKIASLVKEQKVGGLILYQGELVEQAKFINDMQRIADIPLLIASDFERGLGTRIDNATEFPHAMALGSANNVSYAYEMGKAISIECRLLGVHWNFAPVADINNNPLNPIINIRAFSENKYEVTKFIQAFIKGAKEERTLTTVKHFPGHGNTTIDSHRDLPRINGSKNFLLKNELYPFIKSIDSKVHSVMIGHLDVPSLEPVKGVPATLSKSIVDHLLKKELGFDGLIVTDAMIMEAITKYYSTEEAVVLAVKAGNDVILMPPDEETAITALNLAVYSGKISISRIDESVRKILAAKRWLRIEQNRYSDIEKVKQSVTIESHINLAKEIAENSITLLKNDDDILPLNINEHKNIYCVTLTDKMGSERVSHFQNIFENRVGEINSALLTKKSKRWEYNNLLKEIKDSDLIILSTFLDVKTYQGPVNLAVEQIDFIASVLRSGVPTVLISFKNPYLLYLFPETSTYLNAFSHSRVSQRAMLRAILGEIDIKGTLPITIPQTEIVFRNGIELQKSLNTIIKVVTDSKVDLNKIDGKINNYFEWYNAGFYDVGKLGGTMHQTKSIIKSFHYGFDLENLYLRIDTTVPLIQEKIGDVTVKLAFLSTKKEVILNLFQQKDNSKKADIWAIDESLENKPLVKIKPIQSVAVEKIIEIGISFADIGVKDDEEIAFVIIVEKEGLEMERWPNRNLVRFIKPKEDYFVAHWSA